MHRFIKMSSLTLMILALTVGTAFAQTKVGVLNNDRLLAESNAGKSIMTGLQAVGENAKVELQTPQKQLMTDQAAVNTLVDGKSQQQVAADPALRARVDSFKKKVSSYAVLEKKTAQEFSLTERQALNQFNQKAFEAVNHVMQQKGLDLVLSKGQYVAAGPSLDITSDVIARLNATTPSINVQRVRLPQTNQ